MRYVLSVVVLLSSLMLACGDPTESTYCTYNSDCPDGGPSFCVLGICRFDECQEDRDCTGSQACIEGRCSDD